jgi:hypothetical protein
MLIWRIAFVCAIAIALCAGCNKTGRLGGDPVSPVENAVSRQAMWFGQAQTIFGTQNLPAADVDLASVIGLNLMPVPPEIELIDWVVAVGIEDPPDAVSYPVVRFLGRRSDGSTVMSDQFVVPVSPVIQGRDCRFPRIDCRVNMGVVDVVVAYRYSDPGYSWLIIEDYWDIRVTHMRFVYIPQIEPPGFQWVLQDFDQLPAIETWSPLTGQSHPDIAYDQDNGDIYCAWTDMIQGRQDLCYRRYSNSQWTDRYYHENTVRDHDPWYVSLDVGLVDGLEPQVTHKVVGFAYTGAFPEDTTPPYDRYWGFRPVVGWWYIDNNVPDDGDHPAQVILVNPNFPPNNPNFPHYGRKYHAGLPRVDIGSNGAIPHGAALVFVQDTERDQFGQLQGEGYYEAYGINSLNYSDPAYTWLSNPGNQLFTDATLPSLAVHRLNGNRASVTYFAAQHGVTDWQVFATLWTLDSKTIAGQPTQVDATAQGEFEMDYVDFLFHDWGTASSIVIMNDTSDIYWAAWSDKLGAYEPGYVRGAMGFANQ